MKQFAIFDENGFPTAFYDDRVNIAPVNAVELSVEQYSEFIQNSGLRRWENGRVIEYTPPVIEPVIILPSVTLWERLTESEADQVGQEMENQPFRTRKIFETAATFRSDHELWPLLEQIATQLFGEARATVLLAP